VTRREFIEWLREVEAALPVASWTVRGIHVWPLIRLSLYSHFQAGSSTHSLGAGWRRLAGTVARDLTAWARASVVDRPSSRRPWERADAVFLSSSIGRRPLVKGKRYDVRSGPYVALLEEMGARCLVWEMSPFGDYNVPRYTPSFFVQPYIMALRTLCQVLPLGEDRVRLEGYDELLARVRKAGLRLPQADPMRLRRDVLFIRKLADTFARWLRRSGARIGFVANTGLQEQAFCLACRELGVVSVEVQHGVQGELQASYGSWFSVPPDGWSTRARVFWNWDDESAAAINRWAALVPERHLAVNGGDPWRELWTHGDSELSRWADHLMLERMGSSEAQKHVLVTLSSRGDPIPALLLEVLLGSPASWRYWFRAHPVNQAAQLREAERLLAPAGVDLTHLRFATEVPLHALLRRVDGHLSVGLSTVITEAAAHGVPSIASSLEAADFFPDEAAAGMLVLATTSSEVLTQLQTLMTGGRRRASVPPARARVTMQRLLSGDLLRPADTFADRLNSEK
jgi:hypothetical protein